ncbi:MAG: hypothetical protein KatS3mg019_1178 [Fimbriimonadales bacterium]|nr:MAG: hypothetical protein KatS3mg019_1178 [Fimbriimonadales bacterium]
MRIVWLSGILGLMAAVAAQETPNVRSMMRDVFPVARVKPGMKGYGLTVFKGAKIERFEVEVVGVLENSVYGRPLVMIMMKGGPITERGAMVIAGMSGSPIFLEGKILGALAYGFIFPKEPVALVTPMEAMLTNLHPRAEAQLAELSQPRMIHQPVRIQGKQYAGIWIGSEQPTMPNIAWARPLMTPLMVSGASPRTMKRLEELLKPFGLAPLMAPGGATQRRVPVQFEPGAAVGAPLVTGDLDLTAIGTLTYRNGDYALAFGHPFLGAGKIEVPMTAAEIVDVFSSYLDSFKLGNRAQTLGTVYYDGAFAIAGRLGQQARMMPMRVRITNTETGMQREFQCELIRHRLFTSQFAALAALEFMDRAHFGLGEATATVRWRLTTKPYGEIQYENRIATRTLLAEGALSDLMYVMNLLQNAPDKPAELESLEMEVVIQPGGRAALIESLQVDKFAYRPGERIEATAMVRLPNGEPQSYRFSLRLPDDALPMRYMLQVSAGGGAGVPAAPAGLLALLLGEEGISFSREDTESALRAFLQSERNFQLVASLNLPFPTIRANGATLLQPPPLMRSVLISQRTSNVRQTPDRIQQVIDTPYVLQGSQSVVITVRPPDTGRLPFGAGAPPLSHDDEAMHAGAEEEDSETTVLVERATVEQTMDASSELPDLDELTSPDSPRPDMPARRERPVSRAPRTWQPSDFNQLRRGVLEGVALQMDGSMRLALAPRHAQNAPMEFIWSALGDEQGLIVGGGERGRVMRLTPESPAQPYPELPGVFVTALARSENGDLYAAVAPEGVVYRLGQRGYEAILQTGARYVNAMLWHEGVLYLATGAPARVLAWNGDALTTLITTDETHFTTLALDKDGALYAGTSERGVVYRIRSASGATPIADLQEPSIMALTTDEAGNLYIAAAPSGNLYRWIRKGNLTPLHPQGRLNWRALLRHGQTLYALTENEVYALDLTEPMPKPALMFHQQGLQLVGGSVMGETLHLVSADGRLMTLAPAQEGVYLSPVLDAGTPARWGALRWNATLPDGAAVAIQTRSGNTREPDATWSAWTTAYADPNGSTILSPPAQYLQVRVHLKASGEAQPTLNQFSVRYMPANRPPEVQLLRLQPYAALSGKYTLVWRGRDPDGDQLRFEAQISRDGGRTWEPLRNGKLPQGNNAPADSESTVEANLTDIQIDRSAPPELREQLRQRLMQAVQARVGEPSSADDAELVAERAPQNRFVWNTEQTPDGVYLLRMMATDQPASPSDYATVYSPVVPVVVCNTPPVLLVSERSLTVGEDGVAELSGFALQYFAEPNKPAENAEGQPAPDRTPRHSMPIIGVQYKIGDGEWLSAEPTDGMFDSAFEMFRVRTLKLPAGEHTLTIKAFNAAAKSVEVQQKVRVKP